MARPLAFIEAQKPTGPIHLQILFSIVHLSSEHTQLKKTNIGPRLSSHAWTFHLLVLAALGNFFEYVLVKDCRMVSGI